MLLYRFEGELVVNSLRSFILDDGGGPSMIGAEAGGGGPSTIGVLLELLLPFGDSVFVGEAADDGCVVIGLPGPSLVTVVSASSSAARSSAFGI